MKKLRFFFTLLMFFSIIQYNEGQSFNHPGLLHNMDDLDRMKKGVAEKQEPLFSGFEVLSKHPQSQSSYKMQGPMVMVGRNPTIGQGTYDSDANAAYQCAIMWYITGNRAFADKSIEIVNGWSSTLKSITGRDAVLMAGLGPFKMINAAEILRYTDSGWSEEDIKKTEDHFMKVVYPVIKDFAPFANGNWDAAALQTVMAIGIFCDNTSIFERALRYYVDGWGDGNLRNYIINTDGQIQESGRDQAHTQLGIGLLSECCEMAWHQGLDLYGLMDNRLLKGFEYTAKYNLGNDVPFTPTTDRTGKYVHKVISTQSRGTLRPIYEQIYNHYVNRRGIPAPFTQLAAEKIRPELQGRPGADHPGFGTLLYTRPLLTDTPGIVIKPSAPGALLAKGPKEINLSWVPSINAVSYSVKRASEKEGPYTVIAGDISRPGYTDKDVERGKVYYYSVSASNSSGESPDSYVTSVCAGLPQTWKNSDIGKPEFPGNADYNGTLLRIEGAGTDIGGASDQFHFVYIPAKSNAAIITRFVPQVSSQSTKMGLMFREDVIDYARHVSLLISTGSSERTESPGWRVTLIARDSTGTGTSVISSGENLNEPVVTNGRLTGYYWLKLERTGNIFTGYISDDGTKWTKTGDIILKLRKPTFAGIVVCSGLESVTTTVQVDNISFKR
jgi:hypothetical protein